MAKYNLLDDDDIFDEEENPKPSSEKPKPPTDKENPEDEESIEINIDDDLSEIDPTSEIDDELELEEKPLEFSDVVSSEEEVQEPEYEKEPATDTIFKEPDSDQEQAEDEAEKPYLTDDYEDDKQVGLNYKPIVWIVVILIGIVLTWFALDYFVFSKSDQPLVEEQADMEKTPEEIQREQEAARKAQFLGSVSAQTASDLNMVGSVVDNASSEAKVSVVYLYGDEFLFEVFGKSRDDLAKVNMQLKNQPEKYSVISSTVRPGNNGGVLGVFKAEVKRSASGQVNQVQPKFTSIADFENNFRSFARNSGVKMDKITNEFQTNQNGFQKYEVTANMKGSLNSCKSFLSNLSGNNAHIQIQKLNLAASDQSNFGNNYNLKLILDIFI